MATRPFIHVLSNRLEHRAKVLCTFLNYIKTGPLYVALLSVCMLTLNIHKNSKKYFAHDGLLNTSQQVSVLNACDVKEHLYIFPSFLEPSCYGGSCDG